jgi:hypothetical protein
MAAYHARVYRRGPGQHWFWLGAISGSGGAKLRVRAAMGGFVVAAPVLGWQVSRGLLQAGPDGRLPVIRHTCDESACCNPSHWVLAARKTVLLNGDTSKEILALPFLGVINDGHVRGE